LRRPEAKQRVQASCLGRRRPTRSAASPSLPPEARCLDPDRRPPSRNVTTASRPASTAAAKHSVRPPSPFALAATP
jgi:hypothetical protein